MAVAVANDATFAATVCTISTHDEGYLPQLRGDSSRLGYGFREKRIPRESWTGNACKLAAFVELLASLSADALVLCVDAFDVVLRSDAATLSAAVADAVTAQRVVVAPEHLPHECGLIFSKWTTITGSCVFGVHRRPVLNSGVLIGRAADVGAVFRIAAAAFTPAQHLRSDQRVMNELYYGEDPSFAERFAVDWERRVVNVAVDRTVRHLWSNLKNASSTHCPRATQQRGLVVHGIANARLDALVPSEGHSKQINLDVGVHIPTAVLVITCAILASLLRDSAEAPGRRRARRRLVPRHARGARPLRRAGVRRRGVCGQARNDGWRIRRQIRFFTYSSLVVFTLCSSILMAS